MSAWWRECAAAAGVPDAARDRGEVCLNEAVANVLAHGGAPTNIQLIAEREDGLSRISISDDGAAFDVVQYPAVPIPKTLEAARPGGLGLHILRTMTDEIQYARVNGRNVLTLTFRD
jgi:serine/threonine-protein kinase RsbW